MTLNAHLSLFYEQHKFLDPKRIALLQGIEQTGSISQGAKWANLSYKAAYDAIQAINQLAPSPCVHSEKGGKGGGGAQLTEQGKRFVQMYALLETIQNMGLTALADPSAPLHSLLGIVSQFSLQTSARNQLFGTITQIHVDELMAEVTLQIAQQGRLSIYLTQKSAERLALFVGKDALALIKAPNVQVQANPPKETKNAYWLPLIHQETQQDQQELTFDFFGISLFASLITQSEFKCGQSYWVSLPMEHIILTCLK